MKRTELETLASTLVNEYGSSIARLPDWDELRSIVDEYRSLIFPSTQHATGDDCIGRLATFFDSLVSVTSPLCKDAEDRCRVILHQLPLLRRILLSDAEATLDGDPAAGSLEEILLCYPGFFALSIQRLAHVIYLAKIAYLPRMLTEYAHSLTGIDIHPGAQIGYRFCIDHGTGIVIGETAVIGENVRIYQGVTLGAKSIEASSVANRPKSLKRHPTVGNNCIIYAGATILGGDTVIGDGCVIGGNVWLTHSVPPGERVYYKEK